MSDETDLDEGSVVEYSLAELGFVIVFVLLLMSSWEINTNASNLEKEAASKADLERQLEASKSKAKELAAVIAKIDPSLLPVLPNDLVFVEKAEYLALQARAEATDQIFKNVSTTLEDLSQPVIDAITEIASSTETPPEDPLVVSESYHRELKEKIDSLEEKIDNLEVDNARIEEELASAAGDANSSNGDGGGKVGTIGFCTYDRPKETSDKVYGKSVALGTLLVEEDGITLIAKNGNIESGTFVDIAGEFYDTTSVLDALDEFPFNQKLSPRRFQNIGARFVEIGDLPSDKRVACRFGMDYHVPIYSKRSAAMLKNILEGSFYKNAEISDNKFSMLFPSYDFSSKQNTAEAGSSRLTDMSARNTTNNQSKIDSNYLKSGEDKAAERKNSPKILSKSMPKFPQAAARKRIEGIVEIGYIVSTNGRATDIKIIREEPRGYGFGEASITALEKYRFESATENGRVIESEPQKLRFRF
jgi:TonB family protein